MNGLISQAQRSHRRLLIRPTLSAVAAAALFASVVTGCGSDSKTSESSTTTAASGTTTTTQTSTQPTPDAAKLVAESAKTTETLRSVHLALVVTNLPNLPMETVNADVTNEPQGTARAVGDAKVRVQRNGPVQPFEFLVSDKTMYTKGPDGNYQPVGPAEKIYDPGIILDKDKGLAAVVKNVKDPKVDGRETIDGVATVKISGTIDAAVIDPVVPQLGQGVSTLPITLWIADVAPPATGAPTTSVASEAPSPGTGPNLVRFVANRDQGNVQVTFSKWGQPVNIPNPTG